MENDNFGYFEISWAAIAAKNLEKATFSLKIYFLRISPAQDNMGTPVFYDWFLYRNLVSFKLCKKNFSSDHQKTYQKNGAKKNSKFQKKNFKAP